MIMIQESTKQDLVKLAAKLDRAGTDNCEMDLRIKDGTLRVKISYEVVEVKDEQ